MMACSLRFDLFFATITKDLWRGDRVVDGTGLENRRGATHRGFESLPLRQNKTLTFLGRGFILPPR